MSHPDCIPPVAVAARKRNVADARFRTIFDAHCLRRTPASDARSLRHSAHYVRRTRDGSVAKLAAVRRDVVRARGGPGRVGLQGAPLSCCGRCGGTAATCGDAQRKCGGREIQGHFRRTLFETDAGLGRTLVATQRTLCETDARYCGQRRAQRDTSQRQSGGAHFIDQLGRTLRVEVAAQKLADFGGSGVELFAERFDIVAMADELRLQVVDPPR